jgi:hypothetical protein
MSKRLRSYKYTVSDKRVPRSPLQRRQKTKDWTPQFQLASLYGVTHRWHWRRGGLETMRGRRQGQGRTLNTPLSFVSCVEGFERPL